MKLKMARIFAVLFLFALPLAVSATPLAEKLMPGTANYFESFDPEQRPWEPGLILNYEEVFKNYQFYEIVLDKNGSEITVKHYIRGDKAGSEKYQVLPDGSLRKK